MKDLEALLLYPTDAVAAEIKDWLAANPDTPPGRVWAVRMAGVDDLAEIAAQCGIRKARAARLSNTINAVLGEPSTDVIGWMAEGRATTIRVMIRKGEWSEEALTHLTLHLNHWEEAQGDARRGGDTRRRANTEAAERANTPGVYVYALPHYLAHPVEEERTLMKVGHSQSDTIQRFRNQTRTTALPEDPVLLRVYRTEDLDSRSVESKFHTLLEAAGHTRTSGGSAGREWFTTSLDFLDAVADVLGLTAVEVNDDDSE